MVYDAGKLISCRICGAIIVKLSRDVCPKCFQKEEELFQKVKSYLRTSPGSTIEQVASDLKCTEKQVEDFIKSGRLERVGVQINHPCQICQKEILEGIICPLCKKDLKEQVSSLKNSTEDDNGSDLNGKDSGDLDLSKKKNTGAGGHVGKRSK